jgi:hypothetical protein
MKIFKTILIVILILIALPFIIALFVKKEYTMEKEIVINRPEAEVFDYVKHIKNQSEYNVWSMADPNMKTEERGTDGTVGFVHYWNSDEVGEGEQEITRIVEGDRIEMELRFKRPMEGKGFSFMSTEPVDAGSTKVKWGMSGESSYPWNFMNLFSEATMGSAFEDGLKNMKTNLEK